MIILGLFYSLILTGSLFFLLFSKTRRNQEEIISLNNQILEKNKRLITLFNISQIVAQSDNRIKILSGILNELVDLNWEKCAIWKKEKKLKLIDSRGFSKEGLNQLEKEIGKKLIKREVIISKDSQEEFLALIPLITKEQIHGVLAVSKVSEFTPEESELLTIIGKFLSPVLLF
ncbi:MAG: GAF domain-containing protein [Patescibacteria group bacterium]|nr:GAF domain-containing protein [Patescibacteria group bacterium]